MCFRTLTTIMDTIKLNKRFETCKYMYLNKYLCVFNKEIKKLCSDACESIKDIITCKVVLSDLQSYEMDPKQFARSLQSRKITAKEITKRKALLKSHKKPIKSKKEKDEESKSKVKQEVGSYIHLSDIQFKLFPKMDNDKMVFHLDKFLSLLCILKQCSSMSQFVCTLNLYLGVYYDRSVISHIFEYFDRIFGVCSQGYLNYINDTDNQVYDMDSDSYTSVRSYEYDERSAPMENQTRVFEDVRNVLKSWTSIKQSETARKLYKFISVILATGLCKQTNLSFSYQGFDIFHVNAEEKCGGLLDIVEILFETTIYFLERGYEAFNTKDAWKLLYSDSKLLKYEQEVSYITSRITLIESEKLDELGITPLEFEKRAENVLIQTHEYIRQTPPGAYHNVLVGKMAMLDRVMVRLLQVRKNNAIRVRPFSILLFGGSGVGKTAMLSPILHFLASVNNFPSGGESICTLNASDKFQSEYTSSATSVVIDDIANATVAAAEGNHCQLIIDFINNDPKNALKAGVEDKGAVMIKPKFVIGTTNRKDLLAYHYSNEPVSIVRRFDFTITVVVKPEYCLARKQMLNGHLVPDGVPDCWFFTVEQIMPVVRGHNQVDAIGYEIVKWRDMLLENITMPTLLQFLGEQSKAHFVVQDRLVRSATSIFTQNLCESCGQYQQFCLCNRELTNQYNPIEHFEQWEIYLLGANYLKAYTKATLLCYYKFMCMFKEWYGFKNYIKAFMLTCLITVVYFFSTWYILPSVFLGAATVGTVRTAKYVDAKIQQALEKSYRLDNALTLLRIHDKKKACKNIKLMGYGVVTVATIYTLRSLYKKYKTLHNQGQDAMTPPPDAIQRDNPWKLPAREMIPTNEHQKTTTHAQLVNMCANVLAHVHCVENNTGRTFASNAFPICSNVWIINKHAIALQEIRATFTRRDPNLVGSNFTAILSPVHMVDIHGTEFVLMYVPSGGDNKNLIPYLPLTRKGNKTGCTLIYKNDQAVVKNQRVLAEPNIIVSNTIKVQGYSYRTEYPTFAGQCMSVLVSDDIAPRILGFHFAGMTGQKMGGACSLTQDEVNAALEELSERYGVCLSANTGTLRLEDQGGCPNVKLLESIHPKSPLNFLDDNATVLAYGAHDGNRRKFKSEVVQTIISPLVAEVMGVECKHGPPPDMNSYKPWQADLNNMTHVKAISPTLLMCASRDFETQIFEGLPIDTFKNTSPLSNDSNLAGADGVYGIDSINMGTSMGHPWNKPKTHYLTRSDVPIEGISKPIISPDWIWDEVKKAEDILAGNERYYMVFRANLKDEPTKLTKKKVRVFCGAPITGLLLVRKYFLPLAKIIMENSELFECAVGINAHGPQWTRFTKHVTRYGKRRMVAGDYKDYDATMPASVTLAAFQILIRMAKKAGYSKRQLKIMRGLATEICYPLYEYNGELLQILGSNPSGHPLTVFLNSFANSLYIRCAYFSIYPLTEDEKFNEHVALMCYGDDNIMSVAEDRPDFNHTSIAQAMMVYNITYTMAEKDQESIPYIDLDQCTFLKRRMTWNAEFQQFFGPIEETSLFKTLHCVLKSKTLTEQEHAAEAIKNVLAEYFLYGEEVYDDRHAKLTQIASRAKLLHYFDGELPTYEDQKDFYVERYLTPNGGKPNPLSSQGVGEIEIF